MPNSTSDSKNPSEPARPKPPPELGEREFLAAEAAAARQKMADHVERLRDDVQGCADLAGWVRRYPWSTVGVAAGVGFLAATLLANRKPKVDAAQVLADALAAHAASADDRPQPSMFAGLIGELLRGLIGALEPIIANAFRSSGPAGTSSPNGPPPPHPAGQDGSG